MEIAKLDDLRDIANLGLSLAEAKLELCWNVGDGLVWTAPIARDCDADQATDARRRHQCCPLGLQARGQAPQPHSGAPKAQGLRACLQAQHNHPCPATA